MLSFLQRYSDGSPLTNALSSIQLVPGARQGTYPECIGQLEVTNVSQQAVESSTR